MKWIVVGVIIFVLLLVFVIVVNPVLIAITSGPLCRIDSKLSLKNGAIACELLLRNAKADQFITQIHIPRVIAEKYKIEAPAGFRVEELVDAKSDPEWLKQWNQKNLQFVGRMKISPDEHVSLLFPATANVLDGVEINGQFETGKTFGNMLSFFQATPPVEQAPIFNPPKASRE